MPAVKLRSKTLNLSRIFYYLCDIVNGVVAPYAIVSHRSSPSLILSDKKQPLKTKKRNDKRRKKKKR